VLDGAARREAGAAYADAIVRAINESCALVLVLSGAAQG